MAGRGTWTCVAVALTGLLAPAASHAGVLGPLAPVTPAAAAPALPAPAGTPLAFEPNAGHLDRPVRFLARGRGTPPLALGRRGATVHLGERTVGLSFADGRPGAPEGVTRLPGTVTSYLGRDRARWRAGVPTFAAVRYPHVWDGIDVVFHGRGGTLEYDLLLAPGADVQDVALRFTGGRPRVDHDGALLVGALRQPPPVATQGARSVDVAYVLRDDSTVGLRLGAHDPRAAVQIDPVLDYATYVAGDEDDVVAAVAPGGDGTTWVTGETESIDLTGTTPAGGLGDGDAFLMQLSATGAVLRSVYLGGTSEDRGRELALTAEHVFVVGETFSSDLPTSAGAAQRVIGGGQDAFVLRLDRDDLSIGYGTYLGGDQAELANAIAVRPDGRAWIGGSTRSDPGEIGMTGDAVDTGEEFDEDAYIVELASSGGSRTFSSRLGGDGFDVVSGIALAGDAVWLAGETGATGFPLANEVQSTRAGFRDAFVARLGGSLGARTLSFSTLLGGPGDDVARDIGVDGDGNAVVGGHGEDGFPGGTVTGGLDPFVVTIDGATRTVTRTQLFGGTADDRLVALAVASDGAVAVQGTTASADFPVLRPIQATKGAGNDAFLTRLTPAGDVRFSTFLGGDGQDTAGDVAFAPSGRVVVGGLTTSAQLLGETGPDNGVPDDDGWVAVVDDSDVTAPVAAITAAPPALTNSNGATITFSTPDATDVFACRLDDAATFTACTSPVVLDGLGEGQHTFRVRATDVNGNTGPEAVATWTVDATPPDTAIAGAPTGATSATGATLTLSSATADGFSCRLDGAPFAPCTSPVTLAGLADGPHTFQARATDGAQNTDPTPASVTWTVDTTAPAAFGLDAPAAGAGRLPPRPEFRWAATSDAGTSVAAQELWIDGALAATATCADGVCRATPAAALRDGQHSWFARAVDAVGNARVSESRPFGVDAEGPAPFALGAPDDGAAVATTQPVLTWAGTSDAGIGLAGYTVVLDDAPRDVGGATAFTPDPLPEGTHRWRVVARDVHGNERTTAERTFVVDTTAPSAAFAAAPNPSFAGRAVTLDAAGSSDAGGGAIVRHEWDLDGDGSLETDTGAAPTAQRTYPEPGVFAVVLKVTDRAGLTATARVDVRIAPDRSTTQGRQLGVTIADGALYTKSRAVTLGIVAPTWADQMLISNDGGFRNATRVAVAGEQPWTLDSTGAERSGRLVYVRFLRGQTTSETYIDDIILDQLAPVVSSAALPRGARTLRLRAKDRGLAGVAGIQVAASRKTKSTKFVKYRSRVKLSKKAARRPVFVRVRDRAGNRSTWVRAKR